MNNYVMMLLPLPSTPTALHRRPNLPAGQCNLTGGQNPSVSVIYTVDTNVELNQFNDFDGKGSNTIANCFASDATSIQI